MKSGIALGSNIGDRLQNLRQARNEIESRYGPLLCSGVYETEPVGCEPGTAPFLNAVIELNFNGEPPALLDELRAIENRMGRPAERQRNAPRSLDLDILYVGDRVINEGPLVLPHPRLHLRRFVLAPLCDIRPDLALPGFQESAAQLLAKLQPEPGVVLFSKRL